MRLKIVIEKRGFTFITLDAQILEDVRAPIGTQGRGYPQLYLLGL